MANIEEVRARVNGIGFDLAHEAGILAAGEMSLAASRDNLQAAIEGTANAELEAQVGALEAARAKLEEVVHSILAVDTAIRDAVARM